MGEDYYALDERDVERLRALLNAWDEGRLNARLQPDRRLLREPIPVILANTTGMTDPFDPVLELAGLGSAAVQELTPFVNPITNELAYALGDTGIAPADMVNLGVSAIDDDILCLIIREPYSGARIAIPVDRGNNDINSFHQVNSTGLECWYAAGKITDANVLYANEFDLTDQVQFVPFWSGAGGVVDMLGFYLAVATTPNGKIRLGIYTAINPLLGDLRPDTLLADFGEVEAGDHDNVGAHKLASPVSPPLHLAPGTMYWFGMLFKAGDTSAPTQSIITTSVGGSLVDGTTYFYVVTATFTTPAGETLISNEESVAITAPNQTAVLSWGAFAGATGYNIYRSETSGEYFNDLASAGSEGFLASVSGATHTFSDDGSNTPVVITGPSQFPQVYTLGEPDFYALFGFNSSFAPLSHTGFLLGLTYGPFPDSVSGGNPNGGVLPAILCRLAKL